MVWKRKKINKELEKRLIDWVDKNLEQGHNMVKIKKSLIKKYGKIEAEAFVKRNYATEPEDLDEEPEITKNEVDKLNKEVEALKTEAKGEEPKGETPKEIEGEPLEEPNGTPTKPEEVSISKMSTYDIELLNQIVAIHQNGIKIVGLLEKIAGLLKKK